MNEINLYIDDLLKKEEITYTEAQNFLDYAYDLCLDGEDDEEIESAVKELVTEHLNNILK